jgi:zinc-finger of acetyl-transferase ESCO
MTTIAANAGPVTQTCPVCRFMYVPYLAEDRRLHRGRHAEWARPRQPEPDPRFADYVDVIVDKRSPKWMHQLVYERAAALSRDEQRSHVQWRRDGRSAI